MVTKHNMPPYPFSIPHNFGGLQPKISSFKNARFVVLPVPYDMTASYQSGTRNGPRAIIDASTHMELYDEELDKEACKAGIHTLPYLEPTSKGPEEMAGIVYDASRHIINAKKIPVMLGGEHSITFGLVKALKKKYPNMSVLQMDAHADMRDVYQESPYNHACIARRISEICPIVQVGIRSLSVEEAEFLKKGSRAGTHRGTHPKDGSDGWGVKGQGKTHHGISTYFAKDIINDIPAKDICNNLTDDVFVTIDLDVFDPSIMPATGTPEPGGLGWYDVIELLKFIANKKNIIGFDVVELCPIPGNVAPDFMSAKLVYKMMGYIVKKQ
ncbi:MAG: agmatinase family protein [Deltaproteobacteria bacterium]|nr:agmatinase family protein [Deltaproteobacteria bacterium]